MLVNSQGIASVKRVEGHMIATAHTGDSPYKYKYQVRVRKTESPYKWKTLEIWEGAHTSKKGSLCLELYRG